MVLLLLLSLALIASATAPQRCGRDADCLQWQSFCRPGLRCDQSNRVRVPSIASPCAAPKERARLFNTLNGVGGASVGVACIEQIEGCVRTAYCTEDAECSDRRFCNGRERCLAGRCTRSDNYELTCAGCSEETHCGVPLDDDDDSIGALAAPSGNNSNSTVAPTGAPLLLSDSALVGIMALISVLGFVAVIWILCYLFKSRKR